MATIQQLAFRELVKILWQMVKGRHTGRVVIDFELGEAAILASESTEAK